MGQVRIFFFIFALLTAVLIVAFELSTLVFLRSSVTGSEASVRGLGGPYLTAIDAILLYSVMLMGLGHFSFKALTARIASVVTLILSLLGVIVSFAMIVSAFLFIVLTLGLLLAVPIGTFTYLAVFGNFPKPEALSALTFIMVLKLFFVVMLALSHLDYLKNKGLVILISLSLFATWLTSFLIALPGRPLSTITDAVGALITAIIAFILLLLMLITSIIAVIKALKVNAPGRQV